LFVSLYKRLSSKEKVIESDNEEVDF